MFTVILVYIYFCYIVQFSILYCVFDGNQFADILVLTFLFLVVSSPSTDDDTWKARGSR